jgi:hypothetical protein
MTGKEDAMLKVFAVIFLAIGYYFVRDIASLLTTGSMPPVGSHVVIDGMLGLWYVAGALFLVSILLILLLSVVVKIVKWPRVGVGTAVVTRS